METKTCKTCGIVKELSSFYSYINKERNKEYTFAVCRSCALIRTNKWAKNNPDKEKEIQKKSRLKNGRKFYLNQKKKWEENWIEHSNKRRQYDRNSKRKRVYLAEKLVIDQEGKCAICKIEFSIAGRFDVDHSHESGYIRGLLCRKCNSGLHYFEDKEFIRKAENYLNNYPAKNHEPVKY